MSEQPQNTTPHGNVFQAVRSLPWVTLVAETERQNADYRVESDLSIVRTNHEVHDLENLGVAVESISAVRSTATVYVSL